MCRFGGFGDLLMASSVLPGLKRQGYHVTFMTTPKGQDLLREDPHIDAWWIQDEDQVPNAELPAYWEALSTRVDRFVKPFRVGRGRVAGRTRTIKSRLAR